MLAGAAVYHTGAEAEKPVITPHANPRIIPIHDVRDELLNLPGARHGAREWLGSGLVKEYCHLTELWTGEWHPIVGEADEAFVEGGVP
jgi:hypothetical protein